MSAATLALVIIMNGWSPFGGGSDGNAIDHIPGFTSSQKCETAGETIRKASSSPDIIKTICVESAEGAVDPQDGAGYVLAILMSGWSDQGTSARGNAVTHVSGIPSAKLCEAAAEKVHEVSTNKKGTNTACVPL
jgi:hypothetical protein